MTAAPTRLARAVRVHPTDDVAVAVDPLEPADVITVGDETVSIREAIPAGHKVALRALGVGDVVHKYGWAIGRLTAAVEAGDWIHSHNLKTQLEGTLDYFVHCVFNYPTLAECYKVAALDGMNRLRQR